MLTIVHTNAGEADTMLFMTNIPAIAPTMFLNTAINLGEECPILRIFNKADNPPCPIDVFRDVALCNMRYAQVSIISPFGSIRGIKSLPSVVRKVADELATFTLVGIDVNGDGPYINIVDHLQGEFWYCTSARDAVVINGVDRSAAEVDDEIMIAIAKNNDIYVHGCDIDTSVYGLDRRNITIGSVCSNAM